MSYRILYYSIILALLVFRISGGFLNNQTLEHPLMIHLHDFSAFMAVNHGDCGEDC